MKRVLQHIITNTAALYTASLLVSGLHIIGGIEGFLLGGFFLTVGDYIIKPILHIITLPLKLLTFGLFSFLINSISLFIISIIYKKINISSFYFQGISYKGFSIPGFNVSILLSYFIISGTIYLSKKIIFWLLVEDY